MDKLLSEQIESAHQSYFIVPDDIGGVDFLGARAGRDEKVCADVPGARCGRMSIISASIDGRLESPMLFDGHCNASVIDAYFKHVLMPSIPTGSLTVLDNASFHHASFAQALAEAAGCELMFLPPYLPDLNPIEHIWAALKKRLQNGLCEAHNKEEFIRKKCLELCA